MGLLMMSNGTLSEVGQIPGTLDEVARGGQNPGFWVFVSTPLRQWIPPRTGAGAFLQEEDPALQGVIGHVAPTFGREMGAIQESSARAFWAIICWVSVLHSSAAPLHVVENTWGRCPWREEIMGPPNI